MSVARPGCSVPLWLEFSKFCPKNMMLNSYFLRNVSQFISTINENNSSIQVSGYLGLDSWILILSKIWIRGQLDISFLYVSGYLDTWILGYHGYLDNWILGYFKFFRIWITDSQNSLDIQVSGYHIPTQHAGMILTQSNQRMENSFRIHFQDAYGVPGQAK